MNVAQEKNVDLVAILRQHAPLLIAYSGGVDSAFLLARAQQEISGKFLAVIADSESLPREELKKALDLASSLGAPVETLHTREIEDERYAANPVNRCYFCKSALFIGMEKLARARGFATLAYGENADDAAEFRPGSRAAAEFRVIAPLRMAGLAKAEVRELSRRIGLPTADAPAQPCLSSRIRHGVRVTPGALRMVELAEREMRALGFRIFRVRHTGDAARVQVAPEELARLQGLRENVCRRVAGAGFSLVEIDSQPYRGAGLR